MPAQPAERPTGTAGSRSRKAAGRAEAETRGMVPELVRLERLSEGLPA